MLFPIFSVAFSIVVLLHKFPLVYSQVSARQSSDDAARSHWEANKPIKGRAWEEPGDEAEVFDRVEAIE